MLAVWLLAAVLLQSGPLPSLHDRASASSDMAFVTQLDFLSVEEGSSAVLPCIVHSNVNLDRPNCQWWYRVKNEKINVYPDDLSSPSHRGRVSLCSAGDQNSFSITIANVQTTDQLLYVCSFSFIFNSSYHLAHGNGTMLLVHGPLELTKSCFHLTINLTCQVVVPDLDTGDGEDVALLGWQGALSEEHLPGKSSRFMMTDGRILLSLQISVATIHSQGTYTCWLQRGGHLLARESIQVEREGNPALFYAAILASSFLSFLILVAVALLRKWLSFQYSR